MKISEITIALHCGNDKKVVDNQMEILKPLSEKYKIHWNNRIDRYPKAYPSYSQLINHAIATSLTEHLILINDRTTPSVEKTEKIINHLENGIACSLLYNVGYMGFAKELVRTIGFWDERFALGGWEDRDWVFRIAQANLALYESQEVFYDYTWKSPLQVIGHGCRLSEPHWRKKWELRYSDGIVKMIPEEVYEHWSLFLGDSKPEIKNSWKSWGESTLNIGYDAPNSGASASSMISGRRFFNYEDVKGQIQRS